MHTEDVPPSYDAATTDPPPFPSYTDSAPNQHGQATTTSLCDQHATPAEPDDLMDRLRAKQEKANTAYTETEEVGRNGGESSSGSGGGSGSGSTSWLQRQKDRRAEKKVLKVQEEIARKERTKEIQARVDTYIAQRKEARAAAIIQYRKDVAAAPKGTVVPLPAILIPAGDAWTATNNTMYLGGVGGAMGGMGFVGAGGVDLGGGGGGGFGGSC